MDARMRLALGKEPAQRGEMGDAVHGMRGGKKSGGAQIDAFDRVIAEMSSSRARQVARSELPGCSTPRSRVPAPPRTSPRWRPRSCVISSRMTLVSPWRLTPSTMPSSVHCIGGM